MNTLPEMLDSYVQTHQTKMRKYLRKAGCNCKKSKLVYSKNKGVRCTECNRVALIESTLIDAVEGI